MTTTATSTEHTPAADEHARLSDEAVVQGLLGLLAADQVVTDPQVLRQASVDRFKKYPAVHGIYDGPFPAAVVMARSTADVAAVLAFADDNQVNVVPRTGRTGTEGGLEVAVAGSIVLDGSAMDAVLSIDEEDMQAVAQCGVPLQVLEDALRERGLTTGHSPQSKPLAQMGGLVATRSIGQFSTLYGGMEDMLMGVEAVFPGGRVARVKAVPRRSAGPDLRHVVLGNEGALCFITEVTVKVFRHQPENNRFHGYLVDDMRTGLSVLREVVTGGFHPSVARLYDPEDAAQHFSDVSDGRCVLVFVTEGPAALAQATSAEIERVIAGHPHRRVDPARIEQWFDQLNWGQDKIDAEKEVMRRDSHLGYTTEVSADWSRIGDVYDAVMHRVRTEFPRAGDLTMLGGHSSHSYQTGTNMYFVYDYSIRCDPREEIEQYHKPLNAIIVEEALRHGGSMAHHHGIGKYRTPWTEQEHGSSYFVLEALKTALDPRGIMNRGTIFPDAVVDAAVDPATVAGSADR